MCNLLAAKSAQDGGTVFDLEIRPADVLLILICLFPLYNAFGPREMPGTRVLYAGIFIGTACLPFLLLRHPSFPRSQATHLLLAITVIVVLALPILGQPITYPKYILGDIACLLLPLFLIVAGLLMPGLFHSRRSLFLIGTALALSAIVAPFFADSTGRFEPPSLFLIALTWTWAFTARSKTNRIIALFALGLVITLSIASEVRTNAVLSIAGGIPFLLLAPRLGRRLALLLVAAPAIIAWFSLGAGQQWSAFVQESRFKSIASGQTDESLLSRLLEARDAISTAEREWSTVNYLIGYGHGASYVPDASFIEKNVTDEFRVHNIHIGPILLAYRYGLIGVAFYISLCFMIATTLLKTMKLWRGLGAIPTTIAFAVAMSLYFLDFLLRNSTTDPTFSYALAGFFSTRMIVIGQPSDQLRIDGTA